ncbi:MAG: hypothetical protein LBH76_02440, partial [Propionibacteriaceae bacterium]|nr:hypothetical protein [Propionibacteriaceae bacterium]
MTSLFMGLAVWQGGSALAMTTADTADADLITTTAVEVTAGTLTLIEPTFRLDNETDEDPAATAAKVGQSVRVSTGVKATSEDPTPPTFVWQFEWYRNGDLITGATGSRYNPTAEDIGAKLTARVTVSATGYITATDVTPEVTVGVGDLTIETIELPSVGNISTTYSPGRHIVYTTYYSGLSPSLTWQWLRDGEPIDGAVEERYHPTAADVGREVTVQLTAALAGYTTDTKVSNPMTISDDTGYYIAEVTISETAAFGQSVGVSYTHNLPGSASFSFQWYLDDAPISGATGSSYIIASSDIGHTLKVEVTGQASGLPAVTSVSNSVVVAPGEISITELRIEASPEAGPLRAGVYVYAMFLVTTDATVSYEWLRDGAVIPGATEQTYLLTAADVGHAIAVRVSATLSSASTTETSPTVTPGSGVITIKRVTLLGPISVGATAKAGYDVTWEGPNQPAPVYEWQWYRDDVAIAGATNQSYTVVEADAGKGLKVGLTVKLDGYADASAMTSVVQVAAWSIGMEGTQVPGSTDFLLTASVVDQPAGTTVAYQWSKNGVPVEGADGPTFQISDDGQHPQFSVRVTVTDADGVSVSQTQTVTQYGSPTIGEMVSRIIDLLMRL